MTIENVKNLKPKMPLKLNIQYFAEGGGDDLATQIKTGFANLKKANEDLENEIKASGTASQEAKDAVAGFEQKLAELAGELDAMKSTNNRLPGAPGVKSTEQQEAEEAFFDFFRKGAKMDPMKQKALVEDEEGMIIVPEELDREIERELPKITIFRPLVNVRNTSAKKIRKRGLNEVTVGWGQIETSSTKTLSDYESSLKPAERFIHVENLNGLTKIGVDELDDTDVQLQQYLASSFALAAASEEDKAVLVGAGNQMGEPEGILTAKNVKRIETAGVGAVTADDIISLFYGVKAQYRKNGVFIIPSKLEESLRKLKNANGDYIWQAALTAGTPNTLLGRPVYNQDDFPDFAPGVDAAVFGDLKNGYTLADRKGSSIQRLNELYAENGLVGFMFKKRVGGGVDKPEAFAVLKVKEA